jgi:CheY-like chemotaxis protein
MPPVASAEGCVISNFLVLVVEDEPLVRMSAVALIEDAGFDTVEAASADEAIRILEARSDIRIVFTDINLPGDMNGLRLSEFIRDRWPPVELVLTSGRARLREEDLPRRARFLAKPYGRRALVDTLQGFL